MKYAAPPLKGNSCLSIEPLRPNELRYMHWQCKQIAKSVEAYKAAPKQHDEHCYTRRYFFFMREHAQDKQFWKELERNTKPKTKPKTARKPK